MVGCVGPPVWEVRCALPWAPVGGVFPLLDAGGAWGGLKKNEPKPIHHAHGCAIGWMVAAPPLTDTVEGALYSTWV